MTTRFIVAFMLAVAVSLIGTSLEKHTLVMRRRVAQQQYRLDILQEQEARLRLAAQERGAPTRWLGGEK